VGNARDKLDASLFLQEYNNDVEKAAAAFNYSKVRMRQFLSIT
jgi:hypothetical protein